MSRIQWPKSVITPTITNVLATTEAISYHGCGMSRIYCPLTASSTTLDVYDYHTESGTFMRSTDKDGADITLTIAAGNSIALPADMAGAPYIKLVSSADDSLLTWHVSLFGS